MGACKHHDICGLAAEADPEAGLFILHSKNPEKDKEAFAAALEACPPATAIVKYSSPSRQNSFPALSLAS